MSLPPLRVQWTRGELVESEHHVHALWVDEHGREVQAWGDADRMICPRSCLKPLQALPLVLSRAFESAPDPLAAIAIACASHKAQPLHLEFVESWLRRLGRQEDELVCAPQRSRRIDNNCSGKHTGFLAACGALGYETRGYHEWAHPLQGRLRDLAGELSEVNWHKLPTGTDGCGLPTYFLPLNVFAKLMSRFLRPDTSPHGEALALIHRAWAAAPMMIAGQDFLGSELARITAGRVIVKVGAQGNYFALDFERGRALVLNVEDGSERAAEEALLALLLQQGAITSGEERELRRYSPREVRNWAGDVTGSSRVFFPQGF